MLKYIRYSKEKSMTRDLQVCGLCVCRFVGVWCVFVLVHVIVGVRVDVLLCSCVFMLCVFCVRSHFADTAE